MTTSIASVTELAARIPGGQIMSSDTERAQAALDDASALIRSVAAKDWDPDDSATTIPDIVKTICIAVAKRAFVKPESIASETIIAYTASWRGGDSAVFLTKDERQEIRRAAGRLQLWAQPTTRATQDQQGVDIPDIPSVTEPIYSVDPVLTGETNFV